MGFFSEIASSARRGAGYNQSPPSVQRTAPISPPAVPKPEPAPPAAIPAARPVPAPEAASAPVPAPAAPALEPVPVATDIPAEPKREPVAAPEPPKQQPETPSIDLSADADKADEARRKQEHEAAEAKRKAEFDAKQAAKKKARQEQLDKIAAMSDADILAASVERVGADTEKLTRRNMREAVAEHIQAICRTDAAFARLVMDPDKSMISCFKYITRKAREYAEKEMKDLGIEQTGTYGCDVPDGLCFQWAEDYFKDPDAKEDHQDEEKFTPKPYMPNRKASKAAPAKKKSEKKPAEKPKAQEKPKTPELEQMSLI